MSLGAGTLRLVEPGGYCQGGGGGIGHGHCVSGYNHQRPNHIETISGITNPLHTRARGMREGNAISIASKN